MNLNIIAKNLSTIRIILICLEGRIYALQSIILFLILQVLFCGYFIHAVVFLVRMMCSTRDRGSVFISSIVW